MPAHLNLRVATLALICGLTALPVLAQPTPSAADLRALRYYVEQNETAAVNAEIRRLQIDFPNWSPPEDLSDLLRTSPSTEIDQIYARIASGDLAGARALMVETRTKFPSWSPPAEMTSLLELAEAQANFDRAVGARNLQETLAIGVAHPALMRCDRINNIWRLSELQAANGAANAALAGYTQIVQTCAGANDLIATIEKANAVATPEQVQQLIRTASSRVPASAAQFTALEARLLAGRTGAPVATTPAQTATTTPAAPAAQAQTAPAQTAPAQPAPAQPAPERQPAPRPAAPATITIPDIGAPMATIASGADMAYSRLPRTGDPRINQVRTAAANEDFRSCTANSADPRSLDVAYERAWCVYNMDRPMEALALFTAAAGGNLGGAVPRDARYGMALSMLALEMTEGAARIAADTDFSVDQRLTIEGIILDQRGVRAYNEGDYASAITYFNGLEALENGLRRDLAILRGYAYMNAGNLMQAQREFQRLNSELSTPDTREALRNLSSAQ